MILKSFICTLILFSMTAVSHSQGDPESFIKTIYHSLEKRDSALFLSAYLSLEDYSKIILGATGEEEKDSGTVVNHGEPSDLQYRNKITEYVFRRALYSIDSITTDDTVTTLEGIRYEIVKSPNVLFPSLRGELFFGAGSGYYSLPLIEAIFISGKWKLSEIGDLRPLKDKSIFAKDRIKVSAFGTFDDAKLEIKEIKLEKADFLPPPPPPKPGDVKKAGRKN